MKPVLVVCLVAGLAPGLAAGAPPAAFDHGAWDALLRAHVHDGLVDYDAFARSKQFPDYLDALAGARPGTLDHDERLALWINAYNAYTIRLINVHEERESIRNINKTLGVVALKGPWKEPIARVAGQQWSLDQIEHDVIRKRFDEPRIHLALVCAALGCPPLRSEAYVGARLDAQLDDQARRFVRGSPARNRVDVEARIAHLSPIFDWYREDFGGSDAAIGRFVARFLPEGPERDVLESGRFEARWTEYDWSLNRWPR